uniref:Uncharacterized protein n=1 Tax=viral metagenome TaxID=1070528 RepID=A0A6H1ZWS7_9ZZZZ
MTKKELYKTVWTAIHNRQHVSYVTFLKTKKGKAFTNADWKEYLYENESLSFIDNLEKEGIFLHYREDKNA